MHTEGSELFSRGMRVELMNCPTLPLARGALGTVVNKKRGYLIGVEWDGEFFGGHDCDGYGKEGHCWYVRAENIVQFEEELPVNAEDLPDIGFLF